MLVTLSVSFALNAEQTNLNKKDLLPQDRLGQRFTQLVSEQKFNEVDKLINFDGYATRVAKLVFDSNSQQAAFKKGFLQEVQKTPFSEKIFVAALTEPTTFRYLGLNANKTPVLRIDYNQGGHEYIKLIVRPNVKGQLRVEDFMFGSTGSFSSIGTANATKYLIQPSESILKRLLGGVEPNQKLLANFKKLAKVRAEGKNKEGYDLIQSFPDKVKNQKEFLLISIQLSSTFDEAIYRSELSKLARLYGDDPRQAFMLVDHYFYEEDWDKALSAIKTSMKEWGEDGAFNILLAEILSNDGQISAAVNASKRAIELEPNNENVYWGALTKFVKAKKFEDSVSALTVLQNQFSYEFDNTSFTTDALYAEFVKSNAYKVWINN